MLRLIPRAIVAVFALTTAAVSAASDKPTTLIVPFAAGSSVDVIARDFAQSFSAVIKQPVVVDNKTGAEGVIAGQTLVNAPGDGTTLMFTSSSLPVLDPLLRKTLPYDPVKDLVPVCSVGRIGNVMNVTGSSPFKTVAEVVAAAKAEPGKLTFAYTSTSTRLAAELFQQATGAQLRGIPYKSSVGALTDVAGGQVDLVFIDPIVGMAFYPTKKVRPLAVAGQSRIKSLPDVPSAKEAGFPGYDVSPWFGVFANSKTSPAVLAKLREAAATSLKSPQMTADLEKRGVEPFSVCGDDMAKMRNQEIEFWRGVVKKSGIEPQ